MFPNHLRWLTKCEVEKLQAPFLQHSCSSSLPHQEMGGKQQLKPLSFLHICSMIKVWLNSFFLIAILKKTTFSLETQVGMGLITSEASFETKWKPLKFFISASADTLYQKSIFWQLFVNFLSAVCLFLPIVCLLLSADCLLCQLFVYLSKSVKFNPP